jgi:hypothetical protein
MKGGVFFSVPPTVKIADVEKKNCLHAVWKDNTH